MSKLWKILAVAFVAVNLISAPYHVMMGEWTTAFIHVAVLVGGFLAYHFVKDWNSDEPEPVAQLNPEARLDSLQSAIDSIALNVERIGEAQRYQEKLVKERGERSS
ncbi:MAG TPA: hypothetical protein VF042_15740 [Gemmatimonadaceae bacterium]